MGCSGLDSYTHQVKLNVVRLMFEGNENEPATPAQWKRVIIGSCILFEPAMALHEFPPHSLVSEIENGNPGNDRGI